MTDGRWHQTYQKDDAEKSVHKFIIVSNVSQQQKHHNHNLRLFYGKQMQTFLSGKMYPFWDIFWTSLIILFCYWLSLYVWAKKKNLHKNAITFPNHDARAIHTPDRYSFFMCINWKLPNWFIFDILEWNQSVCDCNVNHKENNKCCFCFKRKKSAITFQAIKKTITMFLKIKAIH